MQRLQLELDNDGYVGQCSLTSSNITPALSGPKMWNSVMRVTWWSVCLALRILISSVIDPCQVFPLRSIIAFQLIIQVRTTISCRRKLALQDHLPLTVSAAITYSFNGKIKWQYAHTGGHACRSLHTLSTLECHLAVKYTLIDGICDDFYTDSIAHGPPYFNYNPISFGCALAATLHSLAV